MAREERQENTSLTAFESSLRSSHSPGGRRVGGGGGGVSNCRAVFNINLIIIIRKYR